MRFMWRKLDVFIPCDGDDLMNVWQKLTAFKQQRQIEYDKIMAQYEMLDDLSVDVPMDLGMCNVIE